jgi:hypothetical protein
MKAIIKIRGIAKGLKINTEKVNEISNNLFNPYSYFR